MLRTWLGSALVAAGLLSGCYTGPINMRPTIRIDAPTAEGQALKFTATMSDPDGDTPTLSWGTTDVACPTNFDAPVTWLDVTWKQQLELDLDLHAMARTFCVWAQAKDRYGAATVDALTISPPDNAPVAVLGLVTPANAPSFPVHTAFTLTGERSNDPDGDKIFFEWELKSSPSPTASLLPCGTSGDAVRCLTADAPGDYVVQLRVVDPSMKDAIVEKTLHVLPGVLPTAEIELLAPTAQSPFALGSMFRVSGERSKGGDPDLDYGWDIEAPLGSAASLGSCEGNAATDVRCFVADVPGTYRVALVVQSSVGASPRVSATYVVAADQPPCLDGATPDVGQTLTAMTTFTVTSVYDDFDAYPGSANIQWFVSEGNGPFVLAEKAFPSLTLTPIEYSFGDVVHVRVEIRDRDTERADTEFRACGEAEVCALPSLIHADACLQRVTWTVSFLP